MPKSTLADRLAADVFAADMAGLRALANQVFTNRNAELLDRSLEYDSDQYLPPWPHDTAADLLAAWRAA